MIQDDDREHRNELLPMASIVTFGQSSYTQIWSLGRSIFYNRLYLCVCVSTLNSSFRWSVRHARIGKDRFVWLCFDLEPSKRFLQAAGEKTSEKRKANTKECAKKMKDEMIAVQKQKNAFAVFFIICTFPPPSLPSSPTPPSPPTPVR